MLVFVVDPCMAYISEHGKSPDFNRKGNLNSDIGGLIPKIKLEKESDAARSSKRKRKNTSNV